MVSLFTVSILATFTVGLPLAGAADTDLEMPASASTEVKGPQLISRDQYDAVYTAPGVMVDKESYEAEYGKLNPFTKSKTAGDVSVLYTATLSGYNSKTITPPGGSSSSIDSEFDDNLTYNLCCHGSVDGDSHTHWWGTTPYNADRVKLSDKLTFKGVSVSIGAGSGWSISGGSTSKTATWTGTVYNNWRIDHYYYGITFDGYDLWASHDATGDYKFGTSFYTINAYDSTWL